MIDERLFDILVDSFGKILIPGLTMTIPLTALSFTLALLIAVTIALIQYANVSFFKQLARFYIWVIRGVPLLVQLYVVFYGLPRLGIVITPFPAAVIVFSINEGAYAAEIIRAALESVPIGQLEAGYCAGMSYLQTMRRIVLPQALRTAFPSLSNSLIGMVKDTSLAANITVTEMFMVTQRIVARTYEPLALYIEIGMIYLLFSTVLTKVQRAGERKMSLQSHSRRDRPGKQKFFSFAAITGGMYMKEKNLFKSMIAFPLLALSAGICLNGCTTSSNQEGNEETYVQTSEASRNENIITPAEVKGAVENPVLATRVAPEDEHYIFTLSEEVTRTHVYYKNRYGIELAGDLYIANNTDLNQKNPALVIGPPFGGVKEQGPGVYANQLAQYGFIVLTFDPSYHGYSGGMPRLVGSTDIYAEDFSAGVDYLGLLEYVDREKIGAIGICGSGGFALSAAAQDSRIKAVATSVMYDISSMGNSMTGEARAKQLEQLSAQRWADAKKGTPEFQNSYPDAPVDAVPADMTGNNAEFYSFYATERGWHPNALAGVTATSMLSLMNFPSLAHINEITPRPILFIAGEDAHSIGFSEAAYAAAAEPKELYTVPDAIHIDLYDDVEKIPFDKLIDFFMTAFES